MQNVSLILINLNSKNFEKYLMELWLNLYFFYIVMDSNFHLDPDESDAVWTCRKPAAVLKQVVVKLTNVSLIDVIFNFNSFMSK